MEKLFHVYIIVKKNDTFSVIHLNIAIT